MTTFTLTKTLSQLAHRLVGVGAVIGLCTLATVGATATAARAAEEVSELSVSLSNSVGEVAPDASLDYVAELQNLGSAPVEVHLIVAVPQFSEIETAADASVDGRTATWTLTVEPGTPVSVTTSVQIMQIPAEALWADATANVFVGDSENPVVAATDIDPVTETEVARAEAQKAAEATLAQSLAGDNGREPAAWLLPVLVGGAFMAAALIGAALVLTVRNRRRTATPGATAAGSPRRTARADADSRTV